MKTMAGAKVLWPMTKIQKESNSQPTENHPIARMWCCDLWQRYKKKAIHNSPWLVAHLQAGVVTYDKDTKRKQFTTSLKVVYLNLQVLWPMTKIQKESNSQPSRCAACSTPRCCDLWQRYKKKAIHNHFVIAQYANEGVVTYDKDTKRKQFTTGQHLVHLGHRVLWPMTKIQKESNSQPALCAAARRRPVLWPMTKIQKESNSQPGDLNGVFPKGCCDLWQRYKKKAIHNRGGELSMPRWGVVTYDKDTKRKQFTTESCSSPPRTGVLWPMTKIQKESNSQLWVFRNWRERWCCDLWQRYKKKAIHNWLLHELAHAAVLWSMTKIQKLMTGQESTLRGNPGLPFLCASRMRRDFFLYGDRFFCFLSFLKFLYCLAPRESLSLRA